MLAVAVLFHKASWIFLYYSKFKSADQLQFHNFFADKLIEEEYIPLTLNMATFTINETFFDQNKYIARTLIRSEITEGMSLCPTISWNCSSVMKLCFVIK